MLSDPSKSGLLGLYHRMRNRRTLTVVMFHRVIDPADPRWNSCDPDYTLEASLFERCIRFLQRHYRIVSTDEVLAARNGERALPPRALLITFDDGWSDNVEFALRLRATHCRPCVRVATDRATPAILPGAPDRRLASRPRQGRRAGVRRWRHAFVRRELDR
jgi:hypothetical protein